MKFIKLEKKMMSELLEYLMWYLPKCSQWVKESLRKTLHTQFNLRCICIEKRRKLSFSPATKSDCFEIHHPQVHDKNH